MDNEMVNRVHDAIQNSFNSNDIDCYPIALAAIKAMRDPTDKMKSAGGMMLPDYDPSDEDAATCWKNMIDAIIGDK